MKKTVIFFIIIVGIFAKVFAKEDSSKNIAEEYISIYSDELDGAAESASDDIAKLIPDFNAEDILRKSASGENIFDIRNLVGRIAALMFGEIRSVLKIMLYITALSILSSYLSALPEGQSKEVSEVAFYACYIIIAGICTAAFVEIVRCSDGGK